MFRLAIEDRSVVLRIANSGLTGLFRPNLALRDRDTTTKSRIEKWMAATI